MLAKGFQIPNLLNAPKMWGAYLTNNVGVDPTITEFINTLGEAISVTHSTDGIYNISATNPVFTANKTFEIVNVIGSKGQIFSISSLSDSNIEYTFYGKTGSVLEDFVTLGIIIFVYD